MYENTNAADAKHTTAKKMKTPKLMAARMGGNATSAKAPLAKSVAVTAAAALDFNRILKNSPTMTQNTLANEAEKARMNAQIPTKVQPRLDIE